MNELIEWGYSIIFSLVIAGFMLIFARPAIVYGESMQPTFNERELVLVEKISYFMHVPTRGDIIIAKTKLPLNRWMNKLVIKRIIGLPGDKVVIQDGSVYINGKYLDEPYLSEVVTTNGGNWLVPEAHVFIMGDNRLLSNDSRGRQIGFVPYKDIRGKVYYKLFPFNKIQRY